MTPGVNVPSRNMRSVLLHIPHTIMSTRASYSPATGSSTSDTEASPGPVIRSTFNPSLPFSLAGPLSLAGQTPVLAGGTKVRPLLEEIAR